MESASNKKTLRYHDIFNYPLTPVELKKWSIGRKFPISNFQIKNPTSLSVNEKQNFYFINGRQNIVKQRIKNQKYSQKKLEIAKKASRLISKIPTVLFVGITGSLAMMNSGKESDIDLMIITKKNCLWTTRLLVYGLLRVTGYELRKPKLNNEKDMLCINLWLDESDLVWGKKDRNIYTAHEIAQVVPLVNKEKTYEKFLCLNRWILNYWPNSVKIRRYKEKVISPDSSFLSLIPLILEKFFFRLQYLYMFKKITREIITPTRAIFHPNDWGKKVHKLLKGID